MLNGNEYIPDPSVECPNGAAVVHLGVHIIRNPKRFEPDSVCPTCKGTGKVLPPVTEEDVEAVAESLYQYFGGGYDEEKRSWQRVNPKRREAARSAIDAYRARLGGGRE